ncbi:MAG: AI-2E family transporter [Rhodobacteraceae bacterium]|nr:AI-2E family transporter [Paracoccaceae bacterium]
MSLSHRTQLITWGAVTALFFAVLWILGDVLLPFVVGFALAYLLDPVADRLQRLGVSRLWATAIISTLGLLTVFAFIILLIPAIAGQLLELNQFIPELAKSLQLWINSVAAEYAPGLLERDFKLWTALQDFGGVVESVGMAVIPQIFSVGAGAVNFFVFILVVPVVMVYMLADWDLMVGKLDGWLPRDHVVEIRRLFLQVDTALSGFVRGQLTVCLLVAVFYGVLLQLVGLKFGFSVGFLAGALSFIPFVGAIGGGVLAMGIAIFQFWSEPVWIFAVLAIFVAGQFLEGNILTPRLVGKSVGLHPVWLLFALSAFGALFGFVGLLIAVPAAATVGVFSRFALDKYLSSRLYQGGGQNDDA